MIDTELDKDLLDFMAASSMIFSGFAITTEALQTKVDSMEEQIDKLCAQTKIEWAPLSLISAEIGLTKDAVRKQLQNGDFEEGVDFKYDGNKIVVHQEAIVRLRRKRRSSNG